MEEVGPPANVTRDRFGSAATAAAPAPTTTTAAAAALRFPRRWFAEVHRQHYQLKIVRIKVKLFQ